MIFTYNSTTNLKWTYPALRDRQTSSYAFFTKDRDIELTILGHVFDDDISLSKLDLHYWVRYWDKTGTEQNLTDAIVMKDATKHSGIKGRAINHLKLTSLLQLEILKHLQYSLNTNILPTLETRVWFILQLSTFDRAKGLDK